MASSPSLPSLPPNLLDFSAHLLTVFSEPFHSDPICTFLASLCELEDVHRPSWQQPPAPLPTPPLLQPQPPVPEKHPLSHKSKQKGLDRVGREKTSYRILRDQFPLEADPFSHFLLNHKYKILQFGCAGSVSSRISDDEGVVKRLGNPLYNQDILNLKFDEMADEDALTQAELSDLLKPSMMRRPRLRVIRSSTIASRCHFLSSLRHNPYSSFSLPLLSDIDWIPGPCRTLVHIRDFHLVAAMLRNVELFSKSLRTGGVISTFLLTYYELLRSALPFPHHKCFTFHVTASP
jgi:hypothetical protein